MFLPILGVFCVLVVYSARPRTRTGTIFFFRENVHFGTLNEGDFGGMPEWYDLFIFPIIVTISASYAKLLMLMLMWLHCNNHEKYYRGEK